MALRPFVIKVAFYLPSGRGRGKSLTSAVEHLKYMGDPNRHKKPDEELLLSSAAVHARYMTERPGISGYFGPDVRQLPDVSAIQSTIRDHTGPVWRAFISVTEADAQTLGGQLLTREGWEAATRQELPRMLTKLGLDPTNVEWVASVHKKAGHPHIHLLFWERAVTRDKGLWSERERRGIRQGWVSTLYGPERQRLGQEKSALRQQVLMAVRAHDPGFLTPRMQRAWTERITTLATQMPGTGRAALKFMPPPVKAAALDTASWLLKTIPRFAEEADRYSAIAVELAQHYSDDPREHARARNQAQQDLTERVAQLVIREAAQWDHTQTRQVIRELVSDDAALQDRLWRMTQLTGPEREEAIRDLATQLRGDRDARWQPQLERQIDQTLHALSERQYQASRTALHHVFAGLQAALRDAERDSARAARRRAWEAAQAAWEEERIKRASGLAL